jgi:exopolysaccharide production protein ExoZ
MLPALPPKQPKRTINVVQVLRGIAALLVVSTHVETAYREDPHTGTPWPSHLGGLSGFGGTGLDIFFVISGFIMVYVGVRYFRGEGTIQDFLWRRVLRIFPLYWLVTLLYVGFASAKTLLTLLSGQSFAASLDFDLQWDRLLGAFTLFPTYNEAGIIRPIVGVGWTLSYEIFFYLVFALTVSIGFRWSLPLVAATFAVLAFAPLALGASALASFLTNPVLLEFPMGMLIGYAVVLGLRPPRWLLISSLVVSLLYYLVGIIFNFDYGYHYLHRGIPSALLVFGLIFWEIQFGLKIPPFLIKLGDASYAIYLIHSMVISYLVMQLVIAVPALQKIQVDLLGLATFLIAASIGLLLHEKIERPLQRFIMKRYEMMSWAKPLTSRKPS